MWISARFPMDLNSRCIRPSTKFVCMFVMISDRSPATAIKHTSPDRIVLQHSTNCLKSALFSKSSNATLVSKILTFLKSTLSGTPSKSHSASTVYGTTSPSWLFSCLYSCLDEQNNDQCLSMKSMMSLLFWSRLWRFTCVGIAARNACSCFGSGIRCSSK